MQEQFATIVEQQKKLAQCELEIKRFAQIYNPEFLNNYHASPYSNDRALALKQTIDSGYKKDTKSYVLDSQTVGMLMANDIDIQHLNNLSGTLFQHQLYGEVADCYKKIATCFCQPNFSHSVLAQHGLDFAQQVAKATELEAMELATALSDVAHFFADTAKSIFTGVQESIHGIEQMVKDPAGTIKNFGHSIGKVMNYVAETMMYADPETIGWAYYSKILEQEHDYDVVYANAVVDQIQNWIVNSSGQEKIKIASRFLTDSIVYPRFFNLVGTVGKSCCAVIAEVPGLRFLESFTDIYAEHNLTTTLGDVGINSMQDVGMSLMEGEIEAARYGNIIKSRPIHEALQELRKYGARCKLFQKELKTWFDNIFYKNELLKFYKDFKNPLCIDVMNQGEKVKLFCDLEHIMTYNLKFKPNKNTGLIEGFISGGHVGTYTKELEKAGEIIILAEQALPGGARALEYQHKFGSLIAQKTEFPLSWTAQDIVKSIKGSWENQIFCKFEDLQGRIIGVGKDGLWLDIFLKKLPDGNFRIKSAYPYCKDFSGVVI